MKNIFTGPKMPFEHLPKGLKLPKMPLPSELNKMLEDEDSEKNPDCKEDKKENTKNGG